MIAMAQDEYTAGGEARREDNEPLCRARDGAFHGFTHHRTPAIGNARIFTDIQPSQSRTAGSHGGGRRTTKHHRGTRLRWFVHAIRRIGSPPVEGPGRRAADSGSLLRVLRGPPPHSVRSYPDSWAGTDGRGGAPARVVRFTQISLYRSAPIAGAHQFRDPVCFAQGASYRSGAGSRGSVGST